MSDESATVMSTGVVSASEFADRLVALFVKGGPMGVPRKTRDRQIMMKSAALTLDRDREYSEFEINEALKGWLTVVAPKLEVDHVSLRRMMVDDRYLERDDYGAVYKIGTPREAALFAVEIDAIEVWKVIDEARRGITERRAAARPREGA